MSGRSLVSKKTGGGRGQSFFIRLSFFTFVDVLRVRALHRATTILTEVERLPSLVASVEDETIDDAS